MQVRKRFSEHLEEILFTAKAIDLMLLAQFSSLWAFGGLGCLNLELATVQLWELVCFQIDTACCQNGATTSI